MRTTTAATRVKLVVTSPSDKNRVVWLPYAVAWAAARGIARDTHYAVVLHGEYGTARFGPDGSGVVEWKNHSTQPGAVTRFEVNSTVAV